MLELFHESRIPQPTVKAINHFVMDHNHPGDFLYAVLTNDLRGTVTLADAENLVAIPAIVNYVHYHTPSQCWGTRAKVEQWLSITPSQRNSEP